MTRLDHPTARNRPACLTTERHRQPATGHRPLATPSIVGPTRLPGTACIRVGDGGILMNEPRGAQPHTSPTVKESPIMAHRPTRREFLQTTAATGIGFWVAAGARAEESKSPNEKIRMASIGIGGKGSSDSGDAANSGEMVAICDVDESRLAGVAEKVPQGQAVHRLPQDARRDGQEHRRGHRQHARPHPRPGRADGHADGQALLLPEAADPFDLRSPADGPGRPGEEGRHADGQPGHGR